MVLRHAYLMEKVSAKRKYKERAAETFLLHDYSRPEEEGALMSIPKNFRRRIYSSGHCHDESVGNYEIPTSGTEYEQRVVV